MVIFRTHLSQLIVFFSILVLTTLTASGVEAARFVSINGDNVNVRSGPGTNYQVAMELFDGYPLKVIATQGDWLKIVDFENDSGWIHSSLVNENATVIVNGNNSVNMRAEPSTNSTIIANVERGVVLTRLETRGKWVKLKHSSGLIGWMYGPLLWP